MKLYLMRHGDAVSEQVDPQRPLSPKGRTDVQRVAKFLKRAGVPVSEFFCSTKKRAQETAEIVKNAINAKGKLIEKDYLSPDDPIEKIAYELSQRREDLMVIGHLPQLPRLISRLVVGDESRHVINLDTGSVVAMYRDTEGHWQIVWMVGPALVVDK